jgi:hypothetical protein
LEAKSKRISEKIQLKFKNNQENLNCEISRHVLNLSSLNPSDCGLGCQSHTISFHYFRFRFLCATEKNKQYLVIGHRGKYDKYFGAFDPSCRKATDNKKGFQARGNL